MTSFHRAIVRWSFVTFLFAGAMFVAEYASAQTNNKPGTSPKPAVRQVPTKTAPTKAVTPNAQPTPASKPAASEKKSQAPAQPEPVEIDGKYLLRYKFKLGETLRWEVEHKAEVRTTVAGSTQTAETTTNSVKAWVITRIYEDGNVKFTHMVERVSMRNKLTGRQEVQYNSETDKQAPEGFETMAKEVGVPLSLILTDAKGKVLQREDLAKNTRTGQIIVPMPTERVAVGDVWNIPQDVPVTLKDKTVKQIKTRQRFTLESVNNNIATLQVESQILSPIHDPQIEAQLIQFDFSGTIRFDLEAGRIVSQLSDLDKRVHGFQGDASTMHYMTRFTEKLLPNTATTAKRPQAVAGPRQK